MSTLHNKKDKLKSVTLIGAGNIAWHLGHALFEKGIRIDKIINRNPESGSKLATELGTLYTAEFIATNEASDFTILAISDSCLKDIINEIDPSQTILVHTSGSVSIDAFQGKAEKYGVFYPVQTFTKYHKIDFTNIPVCIEASDPETLGNLSGLAAMISNRVHVTDSEMRRTIHLAGVMVNNFTNHIIARAYDLLNENGIDREIMDSLIEETFYKLKSIEPKDAQTGPARRKNMQIIEEHLKLIAHDPVLKNLYQSISESIIAYYSSNS